MRYFFMFLLVAALASCGRNKPADNEKVITVSIAPFGYFVKELAGTEFRINVMVPPGADPHTYEPYPDQIADLRKSSAYISDGYLGFETTWLGKFYEINRNMKKLNLGDKITPIASDDNDNGKHAEGADPHFWVSPLSAYKIADAVKDLLEELDPGNREEFENNYRSLYEKIRETDNKARKLSESAGPKAFMVYHPDLSYLARDYGLEMIPVEYEGKEPSPARMKYLIDIARKDDLKIILVQAEFDKKSAREIADETGGRIVVIDPLSEDWFGSTNNILDILRSDFEKN